MENRLILSGAFDLSEQLHCNFITNGVRVASLTEPKTFSVGDYTCTLLGEKVTLQMGVGFAIIFAALLVSELAPKKSE